MSILIMQDFLRTEQAAVALVGDRDCHPAKILHTESPSLKLGLF